MSDMPRLSRRAFAIIFCLSITTAIGNTGLQSVLPSIGRSIGIADSRVAAIFSLSSLLWAVTSPFWARQSDLRGRKPLMIIGLAGFAVSMVLCGLVVSAGLAHLTTPTIVFGCFLVCRAIYGLFGSATSPASQTYIAERTCPAERTRWMSSTAGASSLGTVVGPVLAPLFIIESFGYAGPLYAFALIATTMLIIVARYLDEAPILATKPPLRSDKTARGPRWLRSNFVPFIAYGFLLFACQNALAQTLGFLIIDKTSKALPELPSEDLLRIAQGHIEIAMVCGALASLVALWGLIPIFRMTPKALLRWGAGLASLGSVLVAHSPDYAIAIVGYAVASLGFSLARPGFIVGASLSVPMKEQARVAGAIGAISGVNVLFAPFAVSLYEVFPPGPFLLESIVLAGLLAYACLSPTVRNVGGRVSAEEINDKPAT
ncbi:MULTISPECIES: MFS transporter [unclassified Bradyrhizobium]|uniref:MFS transporter n=1 Tax=unclassified Bradyrhizobium TaxID=2631580 RepID=UPI001CD3F1AB|nr:MULTISPECIES: MFS transporter [unclassified Bradyrhizobium]MCA1378655.1 MFS transporter [Bradyrhizobium sp. IC4060]MCA1487735.1 MFS transporter [Bradyrhizobium sp. IC4061]